MTIVDDFLILKKYNFTLLPYYLAKTETEAITAAKKIGYPIAMKIVSPQIEHKTDIGGVKIDIKSDESLRIAFQELLDNAKGKKIDGVLIQKMARKGIELIIGGKKDSQFGHMVVLGLGGVYVEIFKDVSARICPLQVTDIREMISELKTHPLLEGARGKKPINMGKLETLILNVCKMMQEENLKEMDLNPVIFDDEGCDIVDARFVR